MGAVTGEHRLLPQWLAVIVTVGLLGLLGAAIAPAGAAGAQADADPGELDRYLASSLSRTGFPGMAVAITRGTEVVYVRGFGSGGLDQAITPRTQFRLASLSKSFTAVAVLRLVEGERISLDTPVQAYLPDFHTADRVASARITVRHLLNQTSGMADAGFPAVASQQPADLAQLVRSLQDAQLVSEPGREFHYFNPNYQLLARLVEVISGVAFPDYLRDHVFNPLGMTSTVAAETTTEGARAAPRLAHGHILVFSIPIARPELDGFVTGSGGVISTADDMARWLIMQSTGAGPGGQRLLNPADIKLMHTPPPGTESTYGMGWQAVTPPSGPSRIEHTGVLSTFSATQVLLPDSGYAFTLLYDAHSALADTAAVTAGLAARLSGTPAPGSVRSTRLIAVIIGGLTLALLAWRVTRLLRLRRWAADRRNQRWWLVLPGMMWLLAPAGLLLAAPALLLALIGRSFTFWQLALAMPAVMIFLGTAAVSGAAVVIGRIVAILRSH